MDTTLKDELLAFLRQFPSLTPDEVQLLSDTIKVQFFKKGTILVHEGTVCNKCHFVLKGCLRQYFILDGVEKTTQFYTEGQAAALFTSLSTQIKTESYLACVEDSILIIGDPNEANEMYEKLPKLTQITRAMMEQGLGKMQDAFSLFVASSPEERYLNVLKNNPNLLQRVPQHQLASYLGVTPESLSRIRKRIQKTT